MMFNKVEIEFYSWILFSFNANLVQSVFSKHKIFLFSFNKPIKPIKAGTKKPAPIIIVLL